MSDIYKKQAETLRSVNHIITAFNSYIAIHKDLMTVLHGALTPSIN